MEWVEVNPHPKPREEHKLSLNGGGYVFVHRDAGGKFYNAYGSADCYGLLLNKQVANLDDAQRLALLAFRERLAKHLAEVDAAISESEETAKGAA